MRILVYSVILIAALASAAAADYGAGFIAYVRGDYAKALAEWVPLANQGHAEAQRNLGVMYFEGQGVERDPVAAALWYEKAAAQGHSGAQFSLGVMYADGLGVTRDTRKAIDWLRRAADQGHPVAESRLRKLLAEATANPQNSAEKNTDPVPGHPRLKPPPPIRPGAVAGVAASPAKPDGLPAPAALTSAAPVLVPPSELAVAWQAYASGDTQRALQLWQQAAALGNDSARSNIAALYVRGDGVPRDLAMAAQWLRPLAEGGDAAAQFQLAALLRLAGEREESVGWISRAADLGNPWAQAGMGVRQYDGIGAARDLTLAFQWYRRAATGRTLADQPYILDLMAAVPPAREVARPFAASQWLKRVFDPDAADLAAALAAYAAADYDLALDLLGGLADSNIPQAITTLATMLDQGLGVTSDPEGALALLRHAAELGDAEAQYRLAMAYLRSSTLARDEETAVTWLQAAAGQGHALAAYNLGVLSLSRTATPADPQAAAAHFRLAAEAGITLAQYNLALIYARGEGVGRDLAKARDWMAAAAGQGLAEAQFAVGLAFVGDRADYAAAHRWLAAATANAATTLRVQPPSLIR